VGTPYYTAPEVLTEESYDSKCDVWSIGVIAYLILSKTLPFQGKDERETVRILMDAKNHTPSYDGLRWKNVEPEAIDFCRSLLVIDPLKRPTARKAMEHPWIVKHCGVPPSQHSVAIKNNNAVGQNHFNNHVAASFRDDEEEIPSPPTISFSLDSFDSVHHLHHERASQKLMESIPENPGNTNTKNNNVLQRWWSVDTIHKNKKLVSNKDNNRSPRTRQTTESTLIMTQ